LLLLQACATAQSTAVKSAVPQDFKIIPFGQFVGAVNDELKSLPLTVAIPAKYELAKLPDLPPEYSFWMPTAPSSNFRPQAREDNPSGRNAHRSP
jgi:hypothetical protein